MPVSEESSQSQTQSQSQSQSQEWEPTNDFPNSDPENMVSATIQHIDELYKDEDDESVISEDLMDYIPGQNEEDVDETDSDDDSSICTEELHADEGYLYEGSRITSKEMVVLIYAIVFRHNLTKECTEDILKLFNIALPLDTKNLPTSNYRLQKSLNIDFKKSQKHYYCSNCEGPLFSEEESQLCVDCNVVLDKKTLNRHDKFFFLLDIREVLRFALEIPTNGDEILKNTQRRDQEQGTSDIFTDVMDGCCYKALGKNCKDLNL